jgi:hypothetical protein
MQRDFRHLFPQGVNVTFMTVARDPGSPEKPHVLYRCFERAIDTETLSCGTGALACTSVAMGLGLVETGETRTCPYLFDLREPGSFYLVEPDTPAPDQWRITGRPATVCHCLYYDLSQARHRQPEP